MANPLQIKHEKITIAIAITVEIVTLIYALGENSLFLISVLCGSLTLTFFLSLFCIEFSSKTIRTKFPFYRSISSERISSIQFVSTSWPRLIICIDGHQPYHDEAELKLFYLSFRVITMNLPLSKQKCIEYINALKALYGDRVIVEKSFIKFLEGHGDDLREP